MRAWRGKRAEFLYPLNAREGGVVENVSHGAQLLGKARNRARGGAPAPGGAEFLAALKGGCDWYEKLRS